jgi:glycine betaine/proline transport system ATP-binding protein
MTLVQIAKDGPTGSIRKMREIGVDILPVEDEKRRFLGYVWLQTFRIRIRERNVY